jgi:hypothetical protein
MPAAGEHLFDRRIALRGLALVCMMRLVSAASISADELPWAVLPQSQASLLTRQCSRSFPAGLSGAWDPAPADVARAERKIGAAIEAAFATLPERYRGARHGEYYRQYAGFLRDGHRVLYVDRLIVEKAGGPRGSWHTAAVRLCDGGVATFGAVFDLDQDAFESVEFNGTAAGPLRRDD